MTAEVARKLGYDVCPHNGSWGRPKAAGRWQVRRTDWPATTSASVTYGSQAEALAEVEARVAFTLGVSVEAMRSHLAAVLAAHTQEVVVNV